MIGHAKCPGVINEIGGSLLRNGGSHFPERWLSISGLVAQYEPE